jgi:PAS domain S-box-containing protein
VNTLMQELLGFTRGELLGRCVSDVLAPDRAQSVITRCVQVLESRKPIRYEAQFRGTDLLITMFPLGADCVVSAAADITDHKRTEAALRQSEARHRALLENAPVGVAHNALDGGFEYVNRAFCKLVGYTAEELYARAWQDITHPEDVPKDQALAAEVIAGRLSNYNIEKRYIRKDGTVVWVNLFGNFVTDEWGRAVQGVAVAIDITEQRTTAIALNDSREQLVLAKAAARLGVHDWDIRNNIIRWDERTREIWGATLSEPITYEVFVAGLHPDDVARTRVAVEQALDPAGDGHYLATYRVINRIDGKTYWVEATGRAYFEDARPVRLVGTIQDVTERTLAQQRLRDSEARFRELANNIDQIAWSFDPSGTPTWYNQRWYDYTGASADDIAHASWASALHPDHHDRVVRHLEECLTAGEPWEDTFPLRSKSGEYRWFLARAVPIRGASGAILRWFGTHTDVTDLRRLQDALNDASARKDEFLAMLSHELRNPAAAISNATHALGRLLKTRGQEQALVGVIERQIRQMSKLLDDLLDVTRITQGRVEIRRELVTLQACVDLALETAQSQIQRRRHRLTTTQWYEPLWVSVDKIRLGQCITNLLTNAAKYTAEGGEIRLQIFADENTVGIEVRDTGQGISPELLPRIFEWFVQGDRSLDRSGGGLGIGLALCRQLIEMQGGTIIGASDGIGLGAAFTIRLPRASAPTAPALPLALLDRTTFRVLIVDDNRDSAESLDLLLRLEGHTTLVTYSGSEALKHAAGYDPHFVFLDIGLPEVNGYEVAQRLKTIVPRARLIAVTGYGSADDRMKSAQHGFAAHLVKPVSMASIEETLARLG